MVNHIKISPSLSLPRNTPHAAPSPGSGVDHAADLKRVSHYSFFLCLVVITCRVAWVIPGDPWRCQVLSGAGGISVSVQDGAGASSYATLAPASSGIKRYPALIWFDNRYIMLNTASFSIHHQLPAPAASQITAAAGHTELVRRQGFFVSFAHHLTGFWLPKKLKY